MREPKPPPSADLQGSTEEIRTVVNYSYLGLIDRGKSDENYTRLCKAQHEADRRAKGMKE